MLAELIGRKVKITMSEGGKLFLISNLEVTECKDCLIKVVSETGNGEIINTHSSVFFKLELQDGGAW
ncbi:MAG: hypothetical protein A2Y03_09955 [Omnitrophica WOR_2 bacterium GWF2_38_59]|nr:MAG: hypothetical protein A2Y03_09955 [Omnitrophica WOR_2 bacterium GWF2_38_59]OGX50843.1 MAG: hypothetical protein A2243_06060 [Omnitrophica WOR_2 bacterium RIFOXYA2_FULL_38_17]OGX53391.1 MAG: hypothetical protein A2267_01700 [Omnitrophica WOR_2 bacterium RIFOXYA12_FULL_38_10]OGX57180.1 MAG: hypothetical protein A2447_09725 [Omnitrophica WOR_2 bacterium RIFOXYC2_FULL_38_12]OGX59083.1 MAG: hypothetical protein A2306_03530 [Omnitrophica WOR_2 bacterium RIFOXYB2_FULL_38_16]HBG60516.1 hypothet